MFNTSLWAINTSADVACSEQFPAASRTIKLGMSTALSGPIQYLGVSMSQGVQQRIAEANCDAFWRRQGIQFELIVLDDSYDPEAAAQNTRELIDRYKVIAIVGNVGTPTADKTWKIANEKQVVFYGAYTGANILRLSPPAAYVFNYRPSYDQEMDAIVADIVKQGISIKSIGLFLQNDSFGNAGLASLQKALAKVCNDCQENVLQMRYERNSLKTNAALQEFIRASVKPKVVILVGAVEPTAEFIRFAQRLSPATRFYSLSFTSATALTEKLATSDFNLTLSQVVPNPNGGSARVYDYGSIPNEVYHEGYLETELLLGAIRNIKNAVNSQTLRASLVQLESQLPGNAGDHQMMDKVWLTQLHNKNVMQKQGEAANVK
ncbi:ABC transporter substrate-binding protein [Cellvibrio sp. OA-2007]|uniref:ABC transporter substrate-binding protein n=1 Tax=Cellvibrio sp. OA-2007 TaxID=529823 RepID=UPI00187C8688|nr:ABC transporter substrate-binding protein [Cellvibrio sp. OA-2007]